MRGRSPTQFDNYARGNVRHLTDLGFPKTAEHNWRAAIIRAVACPYQSGQHRCGAPKGCECKKAGHNAGRGRIRRDPHWVRMIRAIEKFQARGGCQLCTSLDWMIPRICTCGSLHGVCHGCWKHPKLRGKVPALLSGCPDRLSDADAAMIALASSSL